MFSSDVYQKRRLKLKSLVKKGIIIIQGNTLIPYNYPNNTYPFRQDSTFLYYVGIDNPDFIAIIDAESEYECLFGTEITIDDLIWTGPQPSLAEYASKSGFEKYENISKVYNQIKIAKSLNREIHYISPFNSEMKILLCNLLECNISQLEQNQSKTLISSIIQMRKIKEDIELEEIEKAVNITAQMHKTIIKLTKEVDCETTENSLLGEMYRIFCNKGYFYSFPPIITTHGEIFHNSPSNKILSKGRLLLADMGAETKSHYAGDMTRTIPVGKNFSNRQKDIYNIVLKAQKSVIESSKPGILWKDMHNRTARIITSGLKDLGLLKGDTDEIVEKGAYALFFPHGLGHLLGLDVHDMENLGEENFGYNQNIKRSEIFGPSNLRYALSLEPNMVITNEPGIYFIPELINQWKQQNKFEDYINYKKVEKYLDFGGIRIEDDIQITQTNCKIIGEEVPKTIDEIENFS
ncbi:MAG: aminopeptidase P family protein [Bacteroidales bacterium]|nr:aminopeptidase P family protein [Bacteroidales bacterium]